MAHEYRVIARLDKAHGNKGKVVAVPVDGLPFLLVQGMEVAVVPPTLKGDRFHTVLEVSEAGTGQLVQLSSITTQDQSEELAGRYLLVRCEDLPEDLYLDDPNELIGLAVVDETYGELGDIVEVMRGPVQDVWVIDGPHGEILFPAVEPLISGMIDDDTVGICARLQDLVGYEEA